jgi:hypothetical protein
MGVNNTFSFGWSLIFSLHHCGKANFCRRWNAPDTVLFQQAPFRGAVHTSDLFFLFDGKLWQTISMALLTERFSGTKYDPKKLDYP